MEPSAHLLNEVARRLGDLGVGNAERKAYGIAAAAIRMAVPEAIEQVARARRASEFAVRRSRQDLASMPSLRYALSLYAGGLADGGTFARQALRSAGDDVPPAPTPAVVRLRPPAPDAPGPGTSAT